MEETYRVQDHVIFQKILISGPWVQVVHPGKVMTEVLTRAHFGRNLPGLNMAMQINIC